MQHGTVTGYRYHRCRCDACRRANTDSMRDARQRRTPGTMRASRVSSRKAVLAAAWVSRNRPDVWAEIDRQAKADMLSPDEVNEAES